MKVVHLLEKEVGGRIILKRVFKFQLRNSIGFVRLRMGTIGVLL
jgi:hypothetical protein